jgi:hypothetical protein
MEDAYIGKEFEKKAEAEKGRSKSEAYQVRKQVYAWLRRPLSIAALIEAFRDARFKPKCSSSFRRISRFVIELRSASRKIACTARSISASDGPGAPISPAASDRVVGIATSR